MSSSLSLPSTKFSSQWTIQHAWNFSEKRFLDFTVKSNLQSLKSSLIDDLRVWTSCECTFHFHSEEGYATGCYKLPSFKFAYLDLIARNLRIWNSKASHLELISNFISIISILTHLNYVMRAHCPFKLW